MATTSNFGWTTPDDTDLVKDGALAIRTLGNNIDTSLVDLKGGTTGQILSKNSNTDLDYTWINNDQGDITEVQAGTGISVASGTGPVPVITNTVATEFDAKGDLVVGTGADTFDKLTAGSNGESLVADSTTTTGLRWQGQFMAGKNAIINGDFRINQRAFSSTTTSGTYGFDRFQFGYSGGTVTYSAQTFTPGTAPVAGYEGINFARIVTASQSAVSNFAFLQHLIEDVRTFAGQTVTISFWAKANTGTPKIAGEFAQIFGSGGSGTVTTYAGQATISTSWARYSLTVAVPSVSGKTIGTGSCLGLELWTSAGSDYNARTGSMGLQNVTIDFWGIQVEAGSVATPFTTATGTLAGEYLACARYYQKSYNLGTAPGTDTNDGLNYGAWSQAATTTGWLSYEIVYPVRMRTAATVVTYDVADASGKVSRVTPGGTDQNGVTPSTAFSNEARILVQNSSGNSHAGLALHWTASAEL